MTPREDRALLKALEDAFSKAATERPRRPLGGPDFESSGWIAYEREQMLAEVNRLRAIIGKAPVPTEEFVKAERCAVGHVDYAHKLALGCRDLVRRD